VAAVVFWVGLAALGIVYIAFPAIMALISRQPVDPPAQPACPTATIVIAARNEADAIASKIRSCLAQEYPAERLDIVLVSDESTDDTGHLAVEAGRSRLTLIELSDHGGKALALNAGVQAATGELVVLTDARQQLDPKAVRRLAAHFEDPGVGAVSGDLRYDRLKEQGMQRALHRYWNYEKRIRMGESKIHSCVGATGALYAIRRRLWRILPPGLILDDVFTPMQIVLRGYQVRFEPSAWATDVASTSDSREYRRRVRTLTGNYQLLFELPSLLNPMANPIWLQFVLHKLGRLVTPVFLAMVLIGSIFASGPVYLAALIAQLGFWGFAAMIAISGAHLRLTRTLSLPYTFAVIQGAALRAFVHCLRRDWNVWETRSG